MSNHKGIKIQNMQNNIYSPIGWNAGVEYEENDDEPNNPNMKETKAYDYNTGYDEDADLE